MSEATATEYESKSQPETLKAFCDSLGLEYTAVFVPWSQSRNKKAPPLKPSDYSLNWKITISKGGRSLTTDYMQGIAHIPGYKQSLGGRMTTAEFADIKYACEMGKSVRGNSVIQLPGKPIPAPALHDVMHGLSLDSSVIDSATYEDWASDYGFDPDSREGEKIYRDCLAIALKLRAMLGDETLRQLADACQDY